MFDAERYLKDFGIPYSTSGPDISIGWVGIACPFCRDHASHGGFSPDDYYSCWRCGWHSIEDVVSRLERLQYHEACQRVSEYQIREKKTKYRVYNRSERVSIVKVPGDKPLGQIHQRYLRSRGFDPDQLAEKYGLLGAGPVGPYKFRLIAPIYFNGEIVSYQGRDVTGKAEIPYKACPKDQEIIEHKNIVYNIDNVPGDRCLVVEGIFDVWRLGDGAVATFGVGFRWAQVEVLAARFKKIFLVYDGEPKAQAKARAMVQALVSLGVEAKNCLLSHGDPGEMSEDDARKLKEELLWQCLQEH